MKEEIVRIKEAKYDEPFKTIHAHLEKLEVGQYVYIHKEVYTRKTMTYLLICMNAALRKRKEKPHFELKVIEDPERKYSKVLKVTRIKEKTIYEKTV